LAGSRALKKEVSRILSCSEAEEAVDAIGRYSPGQVINALISRFCDADAQIRWRAVEASGMVIADMAQLKPESARVVMRRFMWMLNDESGGIGWGVPEAMGSAMARSPKMASEYSNILCSYIDPDQNFLEHPILQRGLLWGLGRLACSEPERIKSALPHLVSFTVSDDAAHRGISAWALGKAGYERNLDALQQLFSDETEIDFFENWQLGTVRVGELARRALFAISGERKKS
jgi:HEAT repeat protein